MFAICLQKIGETEINWIIGLNPITKTLILCHLYKMTSMDISSGNNSKKNKSFVKSTVTEDEKL